MKRHKPIRLLVREKFVQSKTGNLKDCEDAIHISDNFVAVIDGATSKTDVRWNQQTGGQLAAKTISQCFEEMPPSCTARQAADLLTFKINALYTSFNMLQTVRADPKLRITATIAAVSAYRGEVWLIGDCQFLLKGKLFRQPKKADEIAANVRSLFAESELLRGATLEELSRNERGHEFILPLLERQIIFQNNPAAREYWYAAVDGFPIPQQGIIVKGISHGATDVVLATDGYPVLKKSLKESELALHDILERDPLLIRDFRSTKGLSQGNVSFDDRAFLKVRVER